MNTAQSNNGTASLVFFYYGDSPFFTLCQETLKLKKAFDGYDFKVLLKHQQLPPLVDLSEKDEKEADVIDRPTKANLFKNLIQLAQEGYTIDLWIFAHGFTNGFQVSKGPFDQAEGLLKSEIESKLGAANTGLDEMPIRMVWGTNCYGASLLPTWLKIGASTAAGSRFINWFPQQFGKFANEWNKGTVSFRQALDRANTPASRTLGHLFVQADALAKRKKEWDGCPASRTVLGKHPCARNYFENVWRIGPDEWDENLSGKDNMNRQSEQVTAGEDSLRKQDLPVLI